MAVIVSNSGELKSALANARAGDEIRLKGGDYGSLSLRDVQFGGEVTITSDRASDPASFSGLNLNDVQNLTFDGVVFDYEFESGDKAGNAAFKVIGSKDIAIENSLFDGDVASGISSSVDGYGFGVGLQVRGSDDVTISGNEFKGFFKGAIFKSSENLSIQNNEVSELRSDGMVFNEVQNVLISGNYFHDFLGSAKKSDHPDMIQFFKAGSDKPTVGVEIKDNVFDIGDGTWTQTIFFGDSKIGDRSLYYQDVVIEGNEIYAAFQNGIAIGLVDGLTIRDNLLVPVEANKADPSNNLSGGVTIPKIVVTSSAQDVEITGNAAYQVVGYDGQSSWTVENNDLLKEDGGLFSQLVNTYEAKGAEWDANAEVIELEASVDDEPSVEDDPVVEEEPDDIPEAQPEPEEDGSGTPVTEEPVAEEPETTVKDGHPPVVEDTAEDEPGDELIFLPETEDPVPAIDDGHGSPVILFPSLDDEPETTDAEPELADVGDLPDVVGVDDSDFFVDPHAGDFIA